MGDKEWNCYKLNELGEIGRGKSKWRPRNDPSLYGGAYPFIQTSDIKDAELYVRSYSQTYNEKGLSQSKLWPEGTLCITIAANIAETAILGIPACFPDSIVGFTPFPEKANSLFIKYYIDTIKLQMQNISRGTTQDNLSLEKLLSIDFIAPPLKTQQKIAYILSAYDDLIENNTRRIRILEEMAQAIYNEWFVNFRFPGHELVKMVEAELGLIPKGWEVTTIREVSEYVNRGVSPKYDDGSESMVINQKCIRDKQLSIGLARRHSTKASKEKQVEFGDVLINSTGVGTLGRVAQVYQGLSNYTVDSHVTIARPNNKVTFDYFGLTLIGLQDYFDRMGIGATNQTELGRDTIANSDFLLPSLQLQEKFSGLVSPMRKNIINLLKRNENLRQQRNLLLSRLVSGELEVEDLEIIDQKFAF